MRRLTGFSLALVLLAGLAVPTVASAQEGVPTAEQNPEETDTGEEGSSDEKNWKLTGKIQTRVGQGTFTSLENDTGVSGERKDLGTAYDRVNMVYTFAPSYKWKEFTFGAEFQLVHWLTAGGGLYGIPAIGGATDASDVYFQDITLSGRWKGYTFDSIKLRLSPSLEVNLPTHKYSRNNTKYFDTSAALSLTRRFFERLTLQGQVSFTKYFYRYKTPAVDLERVGGNNVLYRPGEAEDLGNGLVSVGGYNTSHSLAFGGATQIKIVEDLSASVSYFFINSYAYPGPSRDQYTAENADPKANVGQVVSTGASLSYSVNKYLSLSGGIGSYMTPKTSDNKSFRFPFWNTQGAAANRSWLSFGVSGKY